MLPPPDFSWPLTVEDARRVVRALTLAVAGWEQHYEEDGGRTHTQAEWEAFRVEHGVLIWRLEELAVLPGQALEHSRYAVRPPGDDGDAGVREPRRPRPSAPPASETG